MNSLLIQQQHIMDSIKQVDHLGQQMQAMQQYISKKTKQKQDHVSQPNALWHIDGHHKLIATIWYVVYIGFKSILISFPFESPPVILLASKSTTPDSCWPPFFSHPDTYNLDHPGMYNLNLSWPAAPEMEGISMENGTSIDEGTGMGEGDFYQYMVGVAAKLLNNMQLGDFQPPQAD